MRRSYDLVVVGAGSGDTLLDAMGPAWRSAVVEPDRFGGACLHRGCVPSKMLTATADAVRSVHLANRLGVRAAVERTDWAAVRDRVFRRVDPMHEAMRARRRSSGVEVLTEPARFVGERTLQVGDDVLDSAHVVLAVGSRPAVPDIPGIRGVPFHTSDTIMRIPELPGSMTVIGGGFVGAELAHAFEAFGTEVTVVQRGPRLLPGEDEDISQRFTERAEERFRLLLDAEVVAVEASGSGVTTWISDKAGGATELRADVLLLATGRRPNTDLLDAEAGGIELDRHGHTVTDQHYRASMPGVWSLGDAANHAQLKHRANAEALTLAHNLSHPDDLRVLPRQPTPHAVFSDPQIGAAGPTELQVREAGTPYRVAVSRYQDAAYGWALEDDGGFVKLIAHDETGALLGAHVIGPYAALLVQPMAQAIALGQTADQLAHDVTHIHPTLGEVVENALLALARGNR